MVDALLSPAGVAALVAEEHAAPVVKIVLRELPGRAGDMLRMHEAMHEHDPNSTDIMAALFHAYARCEARPR